MTVSLIVAYDRNRGIGKNNALPWHLPAELAHFKRTTMGKPMVMGRRTFESIGRPLPGRRTLVVSSSVAEREGVEVFPSLERALEACGDAPEIMIIGGAQLYAAALPRADRVYATEVDAEKDVDTYFPAMDSGEWHEVGRERREADEKNPHALDFVIYERRSRGAEAPRYMMNRATST